MQAADIPKTVGVGLGNAGVPCVDSNTEGAGARGLWDETVAEDGTGAGALAFCEVFCACKAAPGLGAALRELLVPSEAAAGGAAPARARVQQSEGAWSAAEAAVHVYRTQPPTLQPHDMQPTWKPPTTQLEQLTVSYRPAN